MEFAPIPDAETAFADGHCRTLVQGGERPSYRIAVPDGEFFTFAGESGWTKRYVRTPSVKAADGVVLVTMAQYRESGVEPLSLEGGQVIERLDDPLASPPPRPKRKTKSRTEAVAEPAPVAPPKPERKPLVVELGPFRGPIVPRTQLVLFNDEPGPAGVGS